MGKRMIVQNDPVEGTDNHNVTGQAQNPAPPPPTVPYKGIGDFDYVGKITAQLSDFVTIDGKPIALKTSQSSLNPGESAPPAGRHSGPAGKNFNPPSPPPNLLSLQVTDLIGEGKPGTSAGSSFVTVGGVKILLDGDKIDTCDGMNKPGNSTVTAKEQDFVSCSE